MSIPVSSSPISAFGPQSCLQKLGARLPLPELSTGQNLHLWHHPWRAGPGRGLRSWGGSGPSGGGARGGQDLWSGGRGGACGLRWEGGRVGPCCRGGAVRAGPARRGRGLRGLAGARRRLAGGRHSCTASAGARAVGRSARASPPPASCFLPATRRLLHHCIMFPTRRQRTPE